jgi:prolyl-tRNA synthetase
LQGVPLRIGIGERDLANGTAELVRRDTLEKKNVEMKGLSDLIPGLLDEIQNGLYQKAKQRMNDMTFTADSYEEFKKILDEKGGFILAHWDGTAETEEKIKNETRATIRCIPLDQKPEDGECMYSGKPSKGRVLFARAY